MKTQQKFYIKKRENPQTGTYYVPMGEMSKAAAQRAEYTVYGSNEMLTFDTEMEYNTKINELKAQGENVH